MLLLLPSARLPLRRRILRWLARLEPADWLFLIAGSVITAVWSSFLFWLGYLAVSALWGFILWLALGGGR
jgi:hypothetical protein